MKQQVNPLSIRHKEQGNSRLDTKVVVPIKYFSNFKRSFDLSLIDGKIELDLSRTRNCLISEISRTAALTANPDTNPPVQVREDTITTSAVFQMNNAELYVPVIILTINDNIKFLEHLKQGFRRTAFGINNRLYV